MNTQEAYDKWAAQYDLNKNRTRDLEGVALQQTLPNTDFGTCLEIGCGAGKNSVWLLGRVADLTGVDLSEAMLAKAREKVHSSKAIFIQADITHEWTFAKSDYNLVTFSLVLEHVEHLQPIITKAANVLDDGGWLYIGELHPFKQYHGVKAHFETEEGLFEPLNYTHHVSDFSRAVLQAGLTIVAINEFSDDPADGDMPRILSLLSRKEKSRLSEDLFLQAKF